MGRPSKHAQSKLDEIDAAIEDAGDNVDIRAIANAAGVDYWVVHRRLARRNRSKSQIKKHAPLSVLIVDDSAFMRIVLDAFLVKHGITVCGHAHYGADAIEMFKFFCPDVVTVDVTLPDVDCVTVVQEILRIDPSAIVIMSATIGHADACARAISAGAAGVIGKPYRDDVILGVLESVCPRATRIESEPA